MEFLGETPRYAHQTASFRGLGDLATLVAGALELVRGGLARGGGVENENFRHVYDRLMPPMEGGRLPRGADGAGRDVPGSGGNAGYSISMVQSAIKICEYCCNFSDCAP